MQLFFQLAYCYSSKKEYKKSIINYEQALKYTTDDDRLNKCNYNIGLNYACLRDYKSAQKYLEKALKLNPNDEEAKELLEDCKKRLR